MILDDDARGYGFGHNIKGEVGNGKAGVKALLKARFITPHPLPSRHDEVNDDT